MRRARSISRFRRPFVLVLVSLLAPVLDAANALTAADFIRGDANQDGSTNIADTLATLGCLFLGERCAPCADAADANDDGAVNIADATFTLAFLFLGGKAPPAPGPRGCGADPTLDRFADCEHAACRRDDPGGCGTLGRGLDIRVPAVRINGRFLLDGAPFPANPLQLANFFLRNARTGDEVYLGLSANLEYDLQVVPGIYDLHYEHKVGEELPINENAVLAAGIEIDADRTLDVDVASVLVQGDITIAGAAPPGSAIENGELFLRDARSGAVSKIGETMNGTYAVRLIPGEYDVLYSRKAGASIVPWNTLGLVEPGIDIGASGILDIDIPRVELSGQITLNGEEPPASAYENGHLLLRDRATGGESYLGQTRYGAYEARLIPGSYDLFYELAAGGGSDVPRNQKGLLAAGLRIQEDTVLDVDIPVVVLEGTLTLNGGPFPNSAIENGELALRRGEDRVYVGETMYGAYVARVLPGAYQILYSRKAGASAVPYNVDAVIGEVTVEEDHSFPIDIHTVTVHFDVRLDGEEIVLARGEQASLFLREVGDGSTVPLGEIYPEAQAIVIPGSYQAYYAYEKGTHLPRNEEAAVGPVLRLAEDSQRDLDIPVVEVSGDFFLEGGAFPPGPADVAGLAFRSPTGADRAVIGSTSTGEFALSMVPGSFEVLYGWTKGPQIPHNQGAVIGCVEPEKGLVSPGR
jgi:hypothetical protein